MLHGTLRAWGRLCLAAVLCLAAAGAAGAEQLDEALQYGASGAAAAAEWDGKAMFDGGQGTVVDPYRIARAQSFLNLSKVPVATPYYFALTADIDFNDLQSSGYVSDGDGRTIIDAIYDFQGNLDGRGHALKNLAVNSPPGTYPPQDRSLGLFASVSNGAVLSNFTLANAAAYLDNNQGSACGVLAGFVYESVVQNVILDAPKMVMKVGRTGCTYGAVAGMMISSRVAGVSVLNADLSYSIDDALYYANSGMLGGLVGWASMSTLGSDDGDDADRLVLTGSLNVSVGDNPGSESFVGGAAGYVYDSKLGNLVVGGDYGDFSMNVSYGQAHQRVGVGGLVGGNDGSRIADSRTSADVSQKVDNPAATGDASSKLVNLGGLLGYMTSGSVTGSQASGSLTATGSVDRFGVGGFAGGLIGGSIDNCRCAGARISLGDGQGLGVGSFLSTSAVGGFLGTAGGETPDRAKIKVTNSSVGAPNAPMLGVRTEDNHLSLASWNQSSDYGTVIDAYPEQAAVTASRSEGMEGSAMAGTGGFAGWVSAASFDNCTVDSVYLESPDLVGGFVGQFKNGTRNQAGNVASRTRIFNCEVDTAYIRAHGSYAGGFAGMLDGVGVYYGFADANLGL